MCASLVKVVCRADSVDLFFFLMIRRPPRSTLDRSSAASDVYKRQIVDLARSHTSPSIERSVLLRMGIDSVSSQGVVKLSLIHISEPTRPY